MSRKLNVIDSQAIDLLLDQSERSRDLHVTTFAQPDQGAIHRVATAQKILHLLDAWTPEEPPTDLIQRTLAKIAASQTSGTALHDDGAGALRSNA